MIGSGFIRRVNPPNDIARFDHRAQSDHLIIAHAVINRIGGVTPSTANLNHRDANGAGIAADIPSIRAEFVAAGVPFEKRVGRLLEGFRLCRALWSGEPVDWDGRWHLEQAQLAPVPWTKGGPPIWLAATVDAGIKRAAMYFDGWLPIGPDAAEFGRRQQLFATSAEQAGRDSAALTTGLYLTVALADTEAAGDRAIDDYLSEYYGVPPAAMRAIQACYGGPLTRVLEFIRGYVEQGAQHIVVRVVGDHKKTLQALSARRDEISA